MHDEYVTTTRGREQYHRKSVNCEE